MAADTTLPRILAIHAHPDDIEFQCAGTLARLKHQGCPIVMVTMTAGDCGSAELCREEIADIRREEAQQAAAILEAEYYCGEFPDLNFDVCPDSRRRVTELIRKARPDIVLTAPPVDYMTDHEVTSRLVRDACFCAPIPNFKTEQWDPAPPTTHIPHLYYVDPIEGIDWFGQPSPTDFIVDISATFELKLQMLACHDSQRAWLRAQHGLDEYLDSCRRWSARRGAEIGAAYGEGFRQHLGHPYPHDNRLRDLLS